MQFRVLGTGTVQTVDLKNYTCEVLRDNVSGSSKSDDVIFASSYYNPDYFSSNMNIPRPGCRVLVGEVEGQSFIICHLPHQNYELSSGSKANYKGFHEELNPGDYCVRRDEGNRIIVRNNGIIQTVCTEYCKTEFFPKDNLISTFCDNYKMETFGGTIEWKRNKKTNNVDYVMKIKSNATLQEPDITLAFGKAGNLVNLNVGPNKCTINISKNGDVTIDSSSQVTIKATQINLNA